MLLFVLFIHQLNTRREALAVMSYCFDKWQTNFIFLLALQYKKYKNNFSLVSGF